MGEVGLSKILVHVVTGFSGLLGPGVGMPFASLTEAHAFQRREDESR